MECLSEVVARPWLHMLDFFHVSRCFAEVHIPCNATIAYYKNSQGARTQVQYNHAPCRLTPGLCNLNVLTCVDITCCIQDVTADITWWHLRGSTLLLYSMQWVGSHSFAQLKWAMQGGIATNINCMQEGFELNLYKVSWIIIEVSTFQGCFNAGSCKPRNERF